MPTENLFCMCGKHFFNATFRQVFGAISIGCGIKAFESDILRERAFLGSVITVFIISVLYLLIFCGGQKIQTNRGNQTFVWNTLQRKHSLQY